MSGSRTRPSGMGSDYKTKQERERERIGSLFTNPQTMQSEVTQTDLSYFDLNTRFRNLDGKEKLTEEKKKTYLKTKETIESIWHQKTSDKVKNLASQGHGLNTSEGYYASFSLKELEILLKNNDRGGNSEEYNDVVTDLELFNSVNVADVYSTYSLLSRLQASCQKYTKTRRRPWSTKGKIRKAIIGQLEKKITTEKEEHHRRIFDSVDQAWDTFVTDKSVASVNRACKEHFELISAALQDKITLDSTERSKYDVRMSEILTEVEKQPVDAEQNPTKTTRLFNAIGWTSRKPHIVDEDEFNEVLERSEYPKKLYHTIAAPEYEPEKGVTMGRQLAGLSNTRHYMSHGIYGKGTYMTMRKSDDPEDDLVSSEHCWTYGKTEGSVQFTLALNERARVISTGVLEKQANDIILNQFPKLYDWIRISEPMAVKMLIGKHWQSSFAAFLGYNVITGMGTISSKGEPTCDYFVACDRSVLTILDEMQRRISADNPMTTTVGLK